MVNLLLSVLSISLTTSVVIMVLIVLGSLINKRYVAKLKYGLWIVLSLRLLVPFNYKLPDVPLQITIPTEVGSVEMSDIFETNPTFSEVQPIEPQFAVSLPAEPQTVAPLSPIVDTQRESEASLTLLQALSYLWAAVASSLFIWHLTGYYCFRRRIKKWGRVAKDTLLAEQLHQLCLELGVRRQIPILISKKADSPMIMGFWRPILVLPEEEHTREESYYILKHELIHYKRRDILVKFMLLLARDIHWFNPIVYLMHREAVVDMEIACDEAVVRGGSFAQREAYSETLMSALHRQQHKGPLLSTQFSCGKRVMKKRFRNILTKVKKKNGVILFLIIFVLSVTVGTWANLVVEASGTDEIIDEGVPDSNATEVNDVPKVNHEADENADLKVLMFGNVGNLGLGTLLYTVPDADDVDYKLYFFLSENEEDRNLTFDLSEASYVFPDAREGNAAIGKFKEIYFMDTADILQDGTQDIIVIAVYEKDGNAYYDTRIYEERENRYVVNTALTQELNEKYYNVKDYPVQDIIALPGEPANYKDPELEDLMTLFYTAYFNKDIDTIEQCLAGDYQGNVSFMSEVSSLDEVEILEIKGWGNAVNLGNIGDECELSLEFILPNEDSLTYLTVDFVKEDTGWKIRWYGLEK